MFSDHIRNGPKINSSGQYDAITIVLRKYGEEVKRMIYMCVKSWPMAEAITQRVFIEVYEQMEGFHNEEVRLRIYSIAFRNLKRHQKSWSYNMKVFKEKPVPISGENEDELLYIAVLTLPIKYREVILLSFYSKFSIDEISSILSISSTKVSSLINKGKSLLQQSLETQGGDFSWEII